MTNATAYYSDRDLAARFGVHRVTLWGWSARGEFPKPVKLGQNCTRWRAADVEAWEAARAGEPTKGNAHPKGHVAR